MTSSSWSIVRHARARRLRSSWASGRSPYRRRAPSVDDAAQERHLAQPVGARERRQARRHQHEIERRRPADLGSTLDHTGIAGEAPCLLGTRTEMGTGGSRQPRIDLVEAAARSHRRQRRGQTAIGRRCVVHVVAGHTVDPVAVGDVGEGVVAGRVERIAVVPQLDEHAIASERLDEPGELARCGGGTVGHESGGHRTLAAAGEHPGMAGDRVGDIGEGELRRTLLAGEMPEAERASDSGVALGAVGEHDQMGAVWIGRVRVGHLAGVDLEQRVGLTAGHASVGVEPGGERDLGTEHGGDAHRSGRLGEADDAVETVVVGDRQRRRARGGPLPRPVPRDATSRRGTRSWSGSGARRRAPSPPVARRRSRTAGAAAPMPARRRRRSTTAIRGRAHHGHGAPREPPRARSRSTTGC